MKNEEKLITSLDSVNIDNSLNKRIKLDPKQEPMNPFDEYDNVYDEYSFERKYVSDLPIMKRAGEILNELEKNNIIIIQGNTGCGKTTQVSLLRIRNLIFLNLLKT